MLPLGFVSSYSKFWHFQNNVAGFPFPPCRFPFEGICQFDSYIQARPPVPRLSRKRQRTLFSFFRRSFGWSFFPLFPYLTQDRGLSKINPSSLQPDALLWPPLEMPDARHPTFPPSPSGPVPTNVRFFY